MSLLTKSPKPKLKSTRSNISKDSNCTFCFGSADDSGAARMGFYYAREFQKQGWTVSAICPIPQPGSTSIIERLRAIDIDVEVGVAIGRLLKPSVVNKIRGHLIRRSSNLLVSMHQVDMKFAALAAKNLAVGYVASGQNTITFSGGWLKQTISRLILRIVMNRSCSEVVATSHRVEQDFRRILRFSGPISILPNGVDTIHYRNLPSERARVRAEFGYNKNTKVFVSVGRITPQKNQLGLLDAFARALRSLTDIHLIFVGGMSQASTATNDELDYFRTVQKRISELGIANRVIITGWRQDVPCVLAAADIYVQSSLWEGTPLAVVEAMASGLPVIVSDNGGVLPDFRSGIHGLIVPNNNTAALVEALKWAGGLDQNELHALGTSAKELACKKYDISIIANQFFQIAKRHAVK